MRAIVVVAEAAAEALERAAAAFFGFVMQKKRYGAIKYGFLQFEISGPPHPNPAA